ncbi:MAG: hypothetical protein K7J15_00360, partial [Candidatus Regiella insecticola]|nr:hypothetical protein [Candidatus Regiella insecticola]
MNKTAALLMNLTVLYSMLTKVAVRRMHGRTTNYGFQRGLMAQLRACSKSLMLADITFAFKAAALLAAGIRLI